MKYDRVILDSLGYEMAPVTVTSSELEERLEPTYEALHIPRGQLEAWTGIKERRYWEPDFPVSEGAIRAARHALSIASRNRFPTVYRSTHRTAPPSRYPSRPPVVMRSSAKPSKPNPAVVAVHGCNIIFHVAAKVGIWGKQEDYFAANVTGTQNVIAAAHRYQVDRLVYTSSPSVVASRGDLEAVEESAPYPNEYLWHYPHTKAMAAHMIIEANHSDLKTVSLRPHLIWGPGDNHLLPRFDEWFSNEPACVIAIR